MFELAFFIVPSFFTYLGYIKSQHKKQIDIFSQWVFLPILFIYSFVSFIIYFLIQGLFFDSSCNLESLLFSTGIGQIKECVSNLSIPGLFFVCVIAYLIGFILKNFKILKSVDFFHKIEPINKTQQIMDNNLNKIPLMIFLNDGNIHIGIPISYDSRFDGIQCFTFDLIFSGYKEHGEISYYTNYLEASDKVSRVFYLNSISSISEFNHNAFLHFLNKKSAKNGVEKSIIKKLENKSIT